jgi:transcriptional regulator GlxA family with amidase domain
LVEIDAAGSPPPAQREAEGTGTDWYTRSVVLLGSDLDQRVPMPAIAAQVGLPYETWRRSFQRRSGRSPARYRLERRLDAAETLLIETPLSVREIASIVGFSDEQHLNRHVRTASGSTPRQFRRSNG